MTRDRRAIRGWAVLGGGLVLLAGAVAWRSEHRAASFALPGRLPVDRVLAELAAVLPDSSGVRQAPLAPRRGLLASAGPRDALIAPPGSRLPLRLRVPPEAVLAFSVGVEGDGAKDRRAAGVRFRVLVDGVERFARVVNPAARRADRVWFDEQVDLSGEAGREVEIVFATDVPGPGTPGGTPGWSGVRVVERHWRARQPADPSTPNVLVLLVDTLRADRLGCYGGVPSPSPTLDALAARGALYEQNVAHAPWPRPSTTSSSAGSGRIGPTASSPTCTTWSPIIPTRRPRTSARRRRLASAAASPRGGSIPGRPPCAHRSPFSCRRPSSSTSVASTTPRSARGTSSWPCCCVGSTRARR